MARYEPLKNLHREKNLFSSRIVVGALICFGLTLLLMARLTRLQVEDHRYYTTRADENRLRVTPVPPVRGLVFDRNGVVLAQNRPAFVLEVVPEQIQDMPSLLMRLGHLVQLTDADIAFAEVNTMADLSVHPPSARAASVGRRPIAPVIPLRTTSAPQLATTLAASGPVTISGSYPLRPAVAAAAAMAERTSSALVVCSPATPTSGT